MLLIDEGHELERQARLDEARSVYEEALRALSREEAPRLASSVLRWIARTYQRAARYDEALDCLTVSLVAAEAYADGAGIGHATNLLAIIRWQEGDLDEAKRLYLEARDHAHHAGEAKLAAMTAQNLGVIASVRGEEELAQRYFESSLREYRELNLPHDVCVALNNLGMLHTRAGSWTDAETAFREALTIADSHSDLEVATQLEVNLVSVLVSQGAWEMARAACERTLLLAKVRGVETVQAEAYKLAGIVARESGDPQAAEENFARAFEISESRHNILLQAEVERERAMLFRSMGRNRNALQSLNRAHRMFSQLRARTDLADITRQTRGLEADFVEVARRWAESTESKDRYTQGHCERVADVACRIASAVGFDGPTMFWFRIGTLLHDVGKLIIPSEVLNKPGRLTSEEWSLMKQHPVAGVELLSEVEFPWDVLPIVRSHHECWDGSGYPDALIGDQIPLTARMVCIADVYDALSTERSYKKAIGHEETIDIMRRDVGRQFDPELFALFEKAMAHAGAGRNAAAAAASLPAPAGRDGSGSFGQAMDELTGISTRRGFAERASAILGAISESHGTATLAVIDVDHFKQVNDTFGHLQGDDVLRSIANVLLVESRDGDVVGRYAGDEFVMLLSGVDVAQAAEVAERVRARVDEMRIPVRGAEEGHVGVSLSIGIASAPQHGVIFESLFAAADRALYEAKRRGRNTVAVAGDDGARGKPKLDTDRFVGRHDEVRQLVSHLEACMRGEPRVVSIVGEAGIGKTTLLRQLAPEVRLRTGAIVFGRSHEPDVRPPYGPWVEAISALHRMGAAPAREWTELRRIVPALRGPGDTSTPAVTDKYALLDELVEYLRLSASTRPLVLVLDDMQWGDSASWDALEHVVSQLDGVRLMLCLTIRREDAERIEASRRRLSRSDRYHEIRLARLQPSHVAEWVADVLHQADPGAELPEFLYRYTEGNPLFVVQVLRALVEEGLIWYGGKRWEWSPVDQLDLPTAVEDLLARRLSRLSPSATRVLVVGAVLGRVFDVDTVQMASGVQEDELLDVIDEGIAAGVIDVIDANDGRQFAFSHRLLTDVLRRSVNPRRLQRVQRRVAEVLESRRPDALTEMAVLFDQGGVPDKAHRYALIAGERAASVYALDDAIASYRIAVRHAGNASERMDARLRLVDVARLAGRYEEGEGICDEILADDERTVSSDRRVMVGRVRLQLRVSRGEPPRTTVVSAEELLSRAKSIAATREQVEVLTILSEAHARLGDLREAEGLAREARALCETVGDGELTADTRVRLGVTLFETDPVEALAEFGAAEALYVARGNRYGQVRCLVNAGTANARLGRASSAEDAYRRAAEMAEQAHVTDLGGLAALNLGVLSLRRGDYPEARDHFSRAYRLFTRVKNEPRRLAALYNQANLARELGDAGEALGLYESASQLADELGLPDLRVGALAGAGLSALSLGMDEHANACRRSLDETLSHLTDSRFQGIEMVYGFLVQHDVARRDMAGAIRRFRTVMEELVSYDVYAYVWFVAECASALAVTGSSEIGVAIDRALQVSRDIQATLLARRLSVAYTVFHGVNVPTAEVAD